MRIADNRVEVEHMKKYANRMAVWITAIAAMLILAACSVTLPADEADGRTQACASDTAAEG